MGLMQVLLGPHSSAYAIGLEANIPECPRWVRLADDFYDDCRVHARYFTRLFYPGGLEPGVPEQHYAWFYIDPKSKNPHFLMGCMLQRDRSLRFLGLYYTPDPSAIAVANNAAIQGIEPDGNVVLSVNDFPVTLTAVRAFSTKKIKTIWKHAVNCESPLSEDGYYYTKGERVLADLSRFDQDHTINIGHFQRTRKDVRYVELFPSGKPRDIIYQEGLLFLIESSGSVLVKKDWLEKKCTEGIRDRIAHSPWLFHQLCRLTGRL